MDEVRLSFGRVGDSFSGHIWVQLHPTRGRLLIAEFENLAFPRMMSKLAEVIREHESATVMMERTEISGSPYRLDQQTVELLRTDPAAAISAMMPEPRTIVIRHRTTSLTPPTGMLRVGHDTIAESFGDQLYCAVDPEVRVECPGCGRWSEASLQKLTCTNPGCGLRMPGRMTGSSWFIVKTVELLNLNLPKYYLPRSWNPKRGWISHQDLQATFDNFQTEREQCFQVNDPRE